MGNVESHIGQTRMIAKRRFLAEKFIGEGGSAYLFHVIEVRTGKSFALKYMATGVHERSAIEEIKKEIDIIEKMRHSSIVQFGDVDFQQVKKKIEVYLLMEYCPGGTLLQELQLRKSHRYQERDLLQLFRQLCLPVDYLHSQQITHRDLKPENFLLSASKIYKLCDFGSAVRGTIVLETKMDRQAEIERVEKTTTALYRAPELGDIDGLCMFGSGKLDEKVDIWALGCILYTLAFLKPPFTAEGLRGTRYTFPADSTYSKDVHTLIAKMLVEDPEERADITHILHCVDEVLQGRPLPTKTASKKTKSASKKAKKVAAPSSAPPIESVDLISWGDDDPVVSPQPVVSPTAVPGPFVASMTTSVPTMMMAPPPPQMLDEFGFPIVTSPVATDILRQPIALASWKPFDDEPVQQRNV